METKDKIIEILERCLEDKGKLPEFYADQILAEFKRVVEEKGDEIFMRTMTKDNPQYDLGWNKGFWLSDSYKITRRAKKQR